MPVSKRDKKVSLTKTTKKGMQLKHHIVEDIRKSLEEYSNLFVFNISNMRHGPMNELREKWKGSRFFLAKRKVMAVALGRSKEVEVKKNLHKVAAYMSGDCGLLFTNEPKHEVIRWFEDYSRMDYAKSGHTATETVVLPEGPLTQFTFSIEPHLRSLGLPTQLQKGVIELRENYTVCVAGAKLTPDQAQILKLFGMPLSEFRVKLICVWSVDGSFEKFKAIDKVKIKISNETTETKKITLQKMKASSGTHQTPNSNSSYKKTTQTVTEFSPKQIPCSSIEEKDKLENNNKESSTDKQKSKDSNETLKELIANPKHQDITPKQKNKTPKIMKDETSALSDTPALIEKLNLEEMSQNQSQEKEEVMQVEPSPKLGRGNPRRSMRTPKPIKRTPEQRRLSVKKLTEPSNSSKANATPKEAKATPKKSLATPKQSVATPQRQSNRISRSFKLKAESEDVEMSL